MYTLHVATLLLNLHADTLKAKMYQKSDYGSLALSSQATTVLKRTKSDTVGKSSSVFVAKIIM